MKNGNQKKKAHWKMEDENGNAVVIRGRGQRANSQRKRVGLEKQKLVINTHTTWSESCSVVSRLLRPHGHSPWNSPGQNTGVGSLSRLQGIFPTQGENPGLLHCRRILYQLSHKGSPIRGEA